MMLDELLDVWLDKLDKEKVKRELCKVYKMYDKKKKPYLQFDTIEIYEELQDIQYAIAYILCEYFNVKDNPLIMDIKWDIYYDYTYHYNSCKKAYEKIKKENDDMEKQYKQEQDAFIGTINDIINKKQLMEGVE